MHDPFDRRVSFSAVDLVKGRLKKDRQAWNMREFIDPIIRKHNLFKDMPFLWVGVTYLYGIRNHLKLKYNRIGKKFGDLFVSLELDMEILEWADQRNLDLLHDIFMIAALEAMIQIGKKYKFETNVFETERAKYGDIPDTIEECKAYHARRA